MEVSTATLRPSCSFQLTAPKTLSNGRSSSLSFNPTSTKGFHLLVKPVTLRQLPVVAAVVGNTTSYPNGCSSGEELPVSDSSNPSLVGDEPRGNGEGGVGSLDDQIQISKSCDKLIDVFMVDMPSPTDWRKLLASSRTWDDLRPHFFRRCQDRAETEDDPGMKHKLLRLGRKLKEIDEDVQRHNELLKLIRRDPSDISEIVSRRRKDFTKEFFVHLHNVAMSYYDNPTEGNALARIGNVCLDAVRAYDSATNSTEALNAAALKFQDIINSPTVDAACRKIDNLADKNQLDSTLAMMITKAWSATKESSVTKDEVKEMMYHTYMTARRNLERQVPKEIRIVKYLLKIKDPNERISALQDAFTPGEIEEDDIEGLYTTPVKLHTYIKAISEAYHLRWKSPLITEAKDLMSPEMIQKLEDLMKVIEKKYL